MPDREMGAGTREARAIKRIIYYYHIFPAGTIELSSLTTKGTKEQRR